jgi:hypothetical protein
MKIYSLNLVKPIEVNDLTRVGRNWDGGYVLCKRQVERTDTLLSFGICDDWSFEADFLRRKPNAVLHGYDYSVSISFYAKSIVNYLLELRYQAPIRCLKCLLGFKRFFNPKKQRFFHKKFVGTRNTATDLCVDEIFKHHLTATPKALSVFVKMDIESAEYRVLPLFEPYFDFINGFAIEFHRMDIATPAFEETIGLLQRQFYVAHVHANNHIGYIEDTNSPRLLEITFINKHLVEENPLPSTKTYPVPDVDFPCHKSRSDLPLLFD